jgi:tetratricopeptide (TPR) repeat protein
MRMIRNFGIAIALIMASCPLAANAQNSIVDAQLEVSTALVQSSITIEAIKKADDAKYLLLQTRVFDLEMRVRDGKAQRVELLAAKEVLIEQLSTSDAAYKTEIGVFRDDVADIASTPEGLAALARFNSGDEVGAVAILDRIRAANDKARLKRSNLESAAEGRRIAALTYDSFFREFFENVRLKSSVNSAGVRTDPLTESETRELGAIIHRYEDITHLDPDVIDDWSKLDQLYALSGRQGDAVAAITKEAALSKSPIDLARSSFDLSSVALDQGDGQRSEHYILITATIMRDLAKSEPDGQNTNKRFLVISLCIAADLLRSHGRFKEAGLTADEAISVAGRILVAERDADLLAKRNLAYAKSIHAEILRDEGSISGAADEIQASIEIYRQIVAADLGNDIWLYELDRSISIQQTIDLARSNVSSADSESSERMDILKRVVRPPGRTIVDVLNGRGEALLAGGRSTEAASKFSDTIALLQASAAEAPLIPLDQRALVRALHGASAAHIFEKDRPGATPLVDQEVQVAEHLSSLDPANIDDGGELAAALAQRATISDTASSWKATVAEYERLKKVSSLSAEELREFADARSSMLLAKPER